MPFHNAASNLPLIRNIVINITRRHGYAFLTKAERIISHNIVLLISLLEWIIPDVIPPTAEGIAPLQAASLNPVVN